MQYLYVLDYADCRLIEIELPDELEEEYNECAEHILADAGYNSDECSWMFSNSPLVRHRMKYVETIPLQGKFEELC